MPGAGKTYFARQLCDRVQAAHVQGDRIRYELFEKPRYDKQENGIVTHLMDYMTEELISAGVSVVYDTNAMRVGQRRALRELAKKAHAEVLLIWLQIDVESAFARIAARDRRRSDDKFAMPLDRTTFDTVISHMPKPHARRSVLVASGKHTLPNPARHADEEIPGARPHHHEASAARVVKPGLVNLVPSPVAGRVDMQGGVTF